MRERLTERRLRIRERLVAHHGDERVRAVEAGIDREAEYIRSSVDLQCVPRATSRARQDYRRMIAELERRTADLR